VRPSVCVSRCVLLLTVLALSSPGAVIPYGDLSPTGNYSAWSSQIAILGSGVQTIDFESHPLGALIPGFYPGVTMTPSGDVNTVTSGAGPGQGNTSSTPLSSGEGAYPASNYLFDGGSPSSLTISFGSPVYGAGLFIIDYFNPAPGDNPLTLEAFTGPNGTGTSLGVVNSVAYNFQNNNMYFMGIVSTLGDIGSVVFTDVTSNTGDTTGIDNIAFSGDGVMPIPEPSTFVLLGAALGVLGLRLRTR
jgi:hypothetical protein